MGSSCPCPYSSLFDGKFFCVNRVGRIQRMEHHIRMKGLGNHNLMMELHNSQEHCIHKMVLRIRMLGIHCSHIRASCPCPCSSSPSGGKFCCMHKLRMEHHRMEQEHHNWKRVLRSCLQERHIPGMEQHNLRKVATIACKMELHMTSTGAVALR
eukprot:TRINITY_DN5272_c0_g1_i1.p1 TRINITY_DN5272_c0_g1~~TRINITY_DN5272_c0_g1_i1.p1  ORF type:complete len:154 (+),score=3.79 TRINITY_DN5272_c0_g1_i1:995-1456(+)